MIVSRIKGPATESLRNRLRGEAINVFVYWTVYAIPNARLAKG